MKKLLLIKGKSMKKFAFLLTVFVLSLSGCDNGATANQNNTATAMNEVFSRHIGSWEYQSGTISSTLDLLIDWKFNLVYTDTNRSIDYNLTGKYTIDYFYSESITFVFDYASAQSASMPYFISAFYVDAANLKIIDFTRNTSLLEYEKHLNE